MHKKLALNQHSPVHFPHYIENELQMLPLYSTQSEHAALITPGVELETSVVVLKEIAVLVRYIRTAMRGYDASE